MARCPACKHAFRTMDDEEGMHDCPHCGHSPGMRRCLICDAWFDPELSAMSSREYCSGACAEDDGLRHCLNCGEWPPANAAYCHFCGVGVQAPAEEQ